MDHRLRPRLHGRDHVPGGADPIPGLGIPGIGGDWAAIVTALPSLRGFWRMGDGADATGPFADTGGYPTGPFPITGVAGDTYNFDYQVTGLLTPDQDDGAIHALGAISYTTGHIDSLEVAASTTMFDDTASHFSIGCLLEPDSEIADYRGGVLANMVTNGLTPNREIGWYIDVVWSSSGGVVTVRFVRSDAAGAEVCQAVIAAEEAVFVMGTYDGSDMNFYVNGTLADTQASTRTLSDSNSALQVGSMGVADIVHVNAQIPFNGILDEISFWGDALTSAQVAALYNASSTVPDSPGKVLTVESIGLSEYQWPHMRVLASDPTAEKPGEFYLNSGDSSFRVWDGSAWKSVVLT